MDMYLAGKRVLITGASQGIGLAVARAFAREGADLHLIARSADRLASVAQELRASAKIAVTIQPADITERGAIDAIAEAASNVDVLINNAGAIPGGDLWAVDADRWRRGWELKVFGYIDLTRAIYPLMKARGGGVILNNIGYAGEQYDFDYVAGSTGNAALMAFTRAMGGRSLDDGIRIIGINAGAVATDRIMNLLKLRAAARLGDAGRYGEYLAAYPLGRAASLEEIADAFVCLASPRAGYTSGTIVTIDGGFSARRSI